VIKTNDGKNAMADELPDDEGAQEQPRGGAKAEQSKKLQTVEYARKGDHGPGYFTIYKKGQGHWTRIGTVIGAALIGIFTAYNLYAYVPTFLPESVSHATGVEVGTGVAIGFCIAYGILCWVLLNKPTNVDFLIATDSEMKKVNWTSRRELIGSTKVVIIFMFFIALFLFVCDIIFIFIFRHLHVLKFGYFG
jgi:preprotein translocase SecE subunit